MDTKIYFWCAALGLLGIITQIIIKVSGFQKQAAAANVTFSIKDYFKNDWAIQALNVITIIVSLVTIDELTNKYPQVLPFLKWFFFFVGYTGSSLLTALLSKTQKTLTTVVDLTPMPQKTMEEAKLVTQAAKVVDETAQEVKVADETK